MPQIDQTKLPKEIKDKYTIVSNAFKLDKVVNPEKDKYKNEPKDEINVVIGDDKQTEFYPQVKMERWTNEVNFSVRLKDTEYEKATVSTLQDKIIWDKGNTKIEFYDYTEGEGGYKMVWYLKKKPATNKIEFTFQSKGLDFFYQPELTPEEIAQGCVRPENVVGSYAVYHQTKGGMNDIYGKEYKAGKAFHLYRPKITDSVGKETWGIYHLDLGNGTYAVEIPQDFLDKAVYPIKSNETFGYETQGGTQIAVEYVGVATTHILGSKFSIGGNGTGDSVTAWMRSYKTADLCKYAIYDSSLNKVAVTDAETLGGTNNSWQNKLKTINLTTNPSLTSGSNYWLVVQGQQVDTTGIYIWYDAGDANQGLEDERESDRSWVNTLTPTSYNTNKYSIYATYTPSGGGARTDRFFQLF